jgi:putative transposase
MFVTWRLYGTSMKFVKEPNEPAGAAFVRWDRELDSAATGPTWLKQPEIARCVVDALQFGERHLKLYTLLAYCVMSNHVHMVIEPSVPIARITKSIKGYTSRAANKLLSRTGERFWRDESYDHWVRDSEERNRVIRYIEMNPVKAGLVQEPEEWRWSSASVA